MIGQKTGSHSPLKDSYDSSRNLKSLAAKAESVQRMIREASNSCKTEEVKKDMPRHFHSSRVIINLSPKRRSTG